jgi:hypothetical protein
VLGAALSNKFSSVFMANLPAAVRAAIPKEALDSLVNNPQALINSGSQSQLQGAFAQFGPQAPEMVKQILPVLRDSLASALSEVFFIGLLIVAAAFAANLFLKEIPLRKKHLTEMAPQKKERPAPGK